MRKRSEFNGNAAGTTTAVSGSRRHLRRSRSRTKPEKRWDKIETKEI